MGAQDRQFRYSNGERRQELGSWLPGQGEVETLRQEV